MHTISAENSFRRRKSWALLLFFILIFSSAILRAQGSPYDFIGFGDPVISQAARIEGLAGSGVAMTEPRGINDLNPAAWSMLTRARIEARLSFTYNRSDLGVNESSQRIVKFG